MLYLFKKIQVTENHFVKWSEFSFKGRQKRKMLGYRYPKVIFFSIWKASSACFEFLYASGLCTVTGDLKSGKKTNLFLQGAHSQIYKLEFYF